MSKGQWPPARATFLNLLCNDSLSIPANAEPSADQTGIFLAFPHCRRRECHGSYSRGI